MDLNERGQFAKIWLDSLQDNREETYFYLGISVQSIAALVDYMEEQGFGEMSGAEVLEYLRVYCISSTMLIQAYHDESA